MQRSLSLTTPDYYMDINNIGVVVTIQQGNALDTKLSNDMLLYCDNVSLIFFIMSDLNLGWFDINNVIKFQFRIILSSAAGKIRHLALSC